MNVIVCKSSYENKYHIVKNNETLFDIAKNFKVPVSYIKKLNKIENDKDFYEGKILFFEKVNYKIHIVKPMETIDSISTMYGIDRNELIKNNNIKSLFIGQQLEI